MTYRELFDRMNATLAPIAQRGGYPEGEASIILEEVTGVSRARLPVCGSQEAAEDLCAVCAALVTRRVDGEPLQYMLGEWEFYGLPFYVGEGVLIPRPETELLVETALGLSRGIPSPSVADLCAGSGCVGVAVAKHLPDCQVQAVEYSKAAMAYLLRNIELNGTRNVVPHHGDVLAPSRALRKKGYDLILANPPYIATPQLAGLQAEVHYEPQMALDGGADGLLFYRSIPPVWLPMLQHGGWLLFEIGWDQGQAVAALLEESGLGDVLILQDYSGNDRVVLGRQP